MPFFLPKTNPDAYHEIWE